MRLAVLIFVIFTISFGSSAPAPRAVDWDAAKLKVDEIYALVSTTLSKIKATANADNPTVGAQITAKLDAASEEASHEFEHALDDIAAQTLTPAEAEVHFDQLLAILATLRENLAGDLAQLTPSVAELISSDFEKAYGEGSALADELYVILAG